MEPGNPKTDAFAVLARAVLLLRVASGSARSIFHQVGLNTGALEFWWSKVGETRGLWKPDFPPAVLTDLWADIEDGLREIDDIEKRAPELLASINSLAYGIAGRFNIFASHERVGLWGLCPL